MPEKPIPAHMKPMDLGAQPSSGKAELPPSILEAAHRAAGSEPPPPKEPPAAPEPPKPEAKAPGAPEAPKPEPKAPEAKPAPKKDGPAELREAYERQKDKVTELENSVNASTSAIAAAKEKEAALLRKIAEFEEKTTKEYQPALQRLTEVEKRLQEREEALRIRDYTATTEWHEKYERPLAETRSEVQSFMGELTVNTPEGERPASIQDFEAILSQPNHTMAAKVAKQIFGEDVYQSVLSYRMKLLSLNRSRQEALKNAALESTEYQKRAEAAQAQAREMFRQKLQAAEKAIRDQHKDIFAAPEDDEEWNAALNEGFRLIEEADSVDFSQPDRLASAAARVRSEASASPVLRKMLARRDKQIAELTEQLKQYQSTEPEVKTRENPSAIDAGGSDAKAQLLKAAQALAAGRTL